MWAAVARAPTYAGGRGAAGVRAAGARMATCAGDDLRGRRGWRAGGWLGRGWRAGGWRGRLTALMKKVRKG